MSLAILGRNALERVLHASLVASHTHSATVARLKALLTRRSLLFAPQTRSFLTGAPWRPLFSSQYSGGGGEAHGRRALYRPTMVSHDGVSIRSEEDARARNASGGGAGAHRQRICDLRGDLDDADGGGRDRRVLERPSGPCQRSRPPRPPSPRSPPAPALSTRLIASLSRLRGRARGQRWGWDGRPEGEGEEGPGEE